MNAYDIIVIGGGLIGSSLAYGLSRTGASVALLDEGDIAYRASRGNFGLVWVQSKGDGLPDYALWTRLSADLWPEFAETLLEETGIAPDYHKSGGLHFCFSDEDMQERHQLLLRMHNLPGVGDYGATMLDRAEVNDLVPGLGPDVVGASHCSHDGHASPLRLLRGLHAALKQRGVAYFPSYPVQKIVPQGAAFRVKANGASFSAGSVVLAAGLGNRGLGGHVGLDVPIEPLKGQILVTERTRNFLSMPTHVIRQTEEGTVMIGDSHEDAGFDIDSDSTVMGEIARRAIRTFPRLEELRIIRSWAALRVMTPDGFPLYQESLRHPGAFSVNCHSGVTLAAAHALALAPMIARRRLEPSVAAFSEERLHVH